MNLLLNRSVLFSVLVGIVYGLATRLIFTSAWAGEMFQIMTAGFLAFTPLATGFIPVFLAERASPRGPRIWFSLPIFTTLAFLLGAWAFLWEGTICILLATPLALVMALIGGGIGGFCARRLGKTPLVCVAVLPFLISPVEGIIGPSWEVREVKTSILIEASPATIWRQIERVAPIQPREQRFAWTQWMGFPRPIEATLSGQGVGAVRHATFEGGVLFIETVTVWEPDRRLVFGIRADTANIPARTLDEHVTVGGPYFDTLEGEYRIEPIREGLTRLHLSSRHRLSTTFNAYASFWTDGIMRDIQENILHVIRNRCEH